MPDLTATAGPVMLTRDPTILDHVLAVAAVARTELEVLSDASALRSGWSEAPMVVIGVDEAPRVAGFALPRRREVYLVGTSESSTDELSRWSVQLGAAVIVLPAGATWLASAMADRSIPDAGGQLLAVVGGSGGVGASTLAAALAYEATRQGRRSLLVDLDPIGGGIDLLVGAERRRGWRWPDLAGARGQLGELAGQLPQVDGLDVLSMARGRRQSWFGRSDVPGGYDVAGWDDDPVTGEPPPNGLAGEPLAAVLRSSLRTYDLVVADLPRSGSPAAAEVLRRADAVLLVVSASVRGVAAARCVASDLRGRGRRVALVARESRTARLDPCDLTDGLGIPVIGVVSEDTAVATAAEKGEPPARAARSALARSCHDILTTVDHLGDVA